MVTWRRHCRRRQKGGVRAGAAGPGPDVNPAAS